MKLNRFFLFATLLSLASLASAQYKTDNQFIPETGPNEIAHSFDHSDGSVTIPGVKLRTAIEIMGNYVSQMKEFYSTDEETAGWDWSLPNLVYTPEAEATVIATDLRIRKVSPLDAIVLIAAAADCELKPILSPDEAYYSEAAGNSGFMGLAERIKIIGYRIVKIPDSSVTHKIPNTLGGMDSGGFDSGFGATEDFSSMGSSSPSPKTNQHVKNPPKGDPGDGFAFHPTESPKQTLAIGKMRQSGASGMDAGMSPSTNPQLAQHKTSVFALGDLLGDDEESSKKQESILEELILDALEIAQIEGDRLTLLFHRESGAMIVKANQEQLEIIEQAIDALQQKQSASN